MTSKTTEAPTPTKTRHRTGAGARFNADHIVLYRAVNVGVLLTAAAAFIVSFNGLLYVSQWMHMPPELAWLIPVMIDLPIIVFTMGMLARRSRGESLWLLSIGAYGLTAISSLANFLHVYAVDAGTDTLVYQTLIGASLAALAPLLVLLTTEVLGSLITKPPAADNPRAIQRRQADEIKAQKATIRKLGKELEAAEKRAVPVRITTKTVGELSFREEVPLVSPATVQEVEAALAQPYDTGQVQPVQTWATKSPLSQGVSA